MKSIVFLGAKDIAVHCLQWLLDHAANHNVEVIGIGTALRSGSPNPITDIAEQYKIPLLAHQDDIPECDYIVSVQYHDILTATNIKKARLLAINLHLAPIPEYRGCNQFSFAIYNQETTFGVTLHEMTARIDHGNIIAEDRFDIAPDIWVEELWKDSNERGKRLFEKTLPLIFDNNYSLQDWTKLGRTERLYYRKDIDLLKKINLETDTEDVIDRKLRACSMPGFPPPYTIINNKKINLTPHD